MCCALTRSTTMAPEHTSPWPRTRPYPEPSKPSAALFRCRSSADYITDTSGSDLRQPQVGLLPDELKHEARFREMAAWLVRRHKPVILLVSAHLLLHGTAS